jgi:hypothetical protein
MPTLKVLWNDCKQIWLFGSGRNIVTCKTSWCASQQPSIAYNHFASPLKYLSDANVSTSRSCLSRCLFSRAKKRWC